MPRELPTDRPARHISDINVRSFGALGDGHNDDTAAVNRALSALAPDGGALYFPAGEYLLSSNLDQVVGKRNIEVFGDGMFVSVLRRLNIPVSGTNFGAISVSGGANWTIRDLSIVGAAHRGRQFSHFGKGIYFLNSPNALVFRVEVLQAEGEGIYASGDSPRTRFLENYVHHGLGAALNLNSSRDVSQDSLIADNYVVDNRSGAVQATASRLEVSRNIVQFPWTLGSDIIAVINAGEFVCDHNTLLNSDISIATVSPIHIWNNDGQSTKGSVCGNRIANIKTSNQRAGGGAGIFVDDVGGEIAVRSNEIRGIGRRGRSGQPAVRVSGPNTGRVCIEANSFQPDGPNLLDVGILVDPSVSMLAGVEISWNRTPGLLPASFGTAARSRRVKLCDAVADDADHQSLFDLSERGGRAKQNAQSRPPVGQ